VELDPLRRAATAAPDGLPVVREVVRGVLGRAFGGPTFSLEEGDAGLYGPGSASWRVLAEPAAIVGGIRALLVQLLHPLAMAGVAEHSAFRTDPLGRLQRTSAYVTATAFGTTEDALSVAARVRHGHTHVRGVAPDGRPYAADDPHLLRWVSIALTSSFLAAYRVYAPEPLAPGEADAFVDEQARAAALLDPDVDLDAIAGDPERRAALAADRLPLPQRDDATLPRSEAELAAALAAYDDELAVGAQGREAVRFLRWPPIGALRAGYLPLFSAAVASLEPSQRRLLGLPGPALAYLPARESGRALLTALRLATGTSPAARAAAARSAAVDPAA